MPNPEPMIVRGDRGQQSAVAENDPTDERQRATHAHKVKASMFAGTEGPGRKPNVICGDITTDRRLFEGRPRPSIRRFSRGINVSRTSRSVLAQVSHRMTHSFVDAIPLFTAAF